MVLRKLTIDTKSQLDAMAKDDVVVKGTEVAPEVILSGIVDPDWQYVKKITVDHTKVESDLDNFPVLISVIDTDLKKAQASGNDFKFTASDETTQLSHEIDKWDIATGELIAWVRVPFLSSVSDTILYLFYNNPEATDQQDIPGTWDSNFKMVQHMKDDPDTSHTKDSTINANNGTKTAPNEPQEVDGIIGKAQSFDGVDDYINCGNDASLNITDAITIEVWVKASSIIETKYFVGRGLNEVDGYLFYVRSTGEIAYRTSQSGVQQETNTAEGVLTIGADHQVILTRSGIIAKIYVNKNDVTEISGNHINPITSSRNLYLGQYDAGVARFHGIIDEVRISNIARSPEWIKTDYNNQSSPDTFVSWGAEEVTEYSTLGTLTSNSEKIDAIILGMLRWVEELLAGTDITFSTRTGPTAPPDESWSAWSGELSNPVGSQMTSPADVYIQFRATLTTTDTSKTPRLYRG